MYDIVCLHATVIHASELSPCIILYVYVCICCVHVCNIVFTIHAQLQYLLFPDVSQVTCQANVQCVLVYTINTSHVLYDEQDPTDYPELPRTTTI